MDIVMKRINGDVALLGLREAGCNVPVIAATGNAMDADRARYLSLGFNAVLAKPFTKHDIAAVLRVAGLAPRLEEATT